MTTLRSVPLQRNGCETVTRARVFPSGDTAPVMARQRVNGAEVEANVNPEEAAGSVRATVMPPRAGLLRAPVLGLAFSGVTTSTQPTEATKEVS